MQHDDDDDQCESFVYGFVEGFVFVTTTTIKKKKDDDRPSIHPPTHTHTHTQTKYDVGSVLFFNFRFGL